MDQQELKRIHKSIKNNKLSELKGQSSDLKEITKGNHHTSKQQDLRSMFSDIPLLMR